MAPEVGASSSKLIKPLIGSQHLAEGVVAAGSSPWLLDRSDMARFGDRGAKAVGSAKLHDMVEIVN